MEPEFLVTEKRGARGWVSSRVAVGRGMVGLVLGGELVFTYSAYGADKVFGKVFKLGTGLDTVFGVSFCGVVFPAANVTYIFFHNFMMLVSPHSSLRSQVRGY